MVQRSSYILKSMIATVLAAVCVGPAVYAEPVSTPWPSDGSVGPKQVAAAGLGGLWAVSDGTTVEVRDVRQGLRLTRTLADFTSVSPGIDPSTARVGRMCFSESGRLLFVLVQRPGSGNPARWEDIIRVDTDTGSFTAFDSYGILPGFTQLPALPIAHSGGRLHVGTGGSILERRALRNDAVGNSAGMLNTQAGVSVTGVTFDRVGGYLFAVDANGVLFRLNPAGGAGTPLGNVGTGACSAAFTEHYGGPSNAGLYIGYTDGRVRFVSAASARGTPPVISSDYTNGVGAQWVSAGSDGSLLIGDDSGSRRVTDNTDARLGFDAWLADEVRQQIVFAKGLISPQGEPSGWVIDGDVAVGGTLFHPATPDAAAWAVLLLTAADDLFQDPQALPLVRTILKRYAGQAAGPSPSRNADGIFRHWINPVTGGSKPGWDPEFATMSTMKLVAAAARAGNHFSQDAEIVSAARQICCSVHNWDAYVQPAGRSMYLKGVATGGTGPDTGTASQPFHEGIIFMEQAAFYGSSTNTVTAYNSWLDRASMPWAQYITTRRVANSSFAFGPAFLSIYPSLLVSDYRQRSDWRDQMANVSATAAAWTDDNSPKWFTVFSAGTTKAEWGGYHADAVNNSPGNVATFTALCGLAARADGLGVREATAAYHAYRTGARQSFRSGASMLFRKSNTDPAWSPGDAGMPDVAMGGLALADVLSAGFIDRVLISALPVCGGCRADLGKAGGVAGADGTLDNNDFIVFINAFFENDRLNADFGSAGGLPGGDGELDNNDFIAFIDAYFGGC